MPTQSLPQAKAGVGIHVFVAARTVRRGWWAGACPRALDPGAHHDDGNHANRSIPRAVGISPVNDNWAFALEEWTLAVQAPPAPFRRRMPDTFVHPPGDHARTLRRPGRSILSIRIQRGGSPIRVNAPRTGHAAAGADHHSLAGRARHVGVSRRGRPLLKAGRSARRQQQGDNHQQGTRLEGHRRSLRTSLGQSLAHRKNVCAPVRMSSGCLSLPRSWYVKGGWRCGWRRILTDVVRIRWAGSTPWRRPLPFQPAAEACAGIASGACRGSTLAISGAGYATGTASPARSADARRIRSVRCPRRSHHDP